MSKHEFPSITTPWPLAQRPGFLIRRLHQIHVALFSELCAEFGVTPVQYSLLSALAARGKADQSTIAADVGLDRTTTAETLRRLANRGLVSREVSKEDRRARLCRLTPSGRTTLRQMEAPVREAHRATVAVLSQAEQHVLLSLLIKAINANAEKVGSAEDLS